MKEEDAILKFRQYMLSSELADEKQLNAIDERARKAVEEAVAFAEQSPMPDSEDLLKDVYVSYK